MRKSLLIITLAVILLLTACGTVPQAQEEAPEPSLTPQVTEAPESTPEPTPEVLKAPFYIKVNNECNTVTVYTVEEDGKLTPCKAMICSTGKDTPSDEVFKITSQGKWEWLSLFGDVFGQYCSQINGNILFHSVPYMELGNKGSLEYWAFDHLGTACSMGCIRLQVIDAKWIYDNWDDITAVEFYSDSEPGPLGKPVPQNIGDNLECRGWDPTDPDPDNPWNK